jgi:trehalose synthase
MGDIVEVDEPIGLEDYAMHPALAPATAILREEAARLAASLGRRTIWMINSTARGGGVAEMLPKQVAILRELGVRTEWAVITSDEPAFFELTKRIHNMMHGTPNGHELSAGDRELYQAVGQRNAERLGPRIAPDDVLVVHDPQPLVVGALLKGWLGVKAIWRCHVGLAERTPVTAAVWRFLREAVAPYDHTVFSDPRYIPGFLRERASIVRPAIDPLSHKNRELTPHRLAGILCNGGLAVDHTPVLTGGYTESARRLLPDGRWAPATTLGDLGLLTRPIVTQISRWDRLKGFTPLLQSFVALKRRRGQARDPLHRRRLELVRLVLAGPDPTSVADDPEALAVLEELSAAYRSLAPDLQPDVALITLPMGSRRENALMVNALQRCSTVIAQNSIQEGFGLTATEAMWKAAPLVVSGAYGLRQQVRDGIEGRVVADPHDIGALAAALDDVLVDRAQRERMGRQAQRRVHEEFLVLSKVRTWLGILTDAVKRSVGQFKIA